ncbi:hypothetical protein IW262DRAFT_1261438, partial [Armillaria fumosa]
FTGKKLVISSTLSNTPCAELGIDGVLEKLNKTLGTSYTLGSKTLRLLGFIQLCSILEPYVTRNENFSTVYTHLWPYWYHHDVATIQYKLCALEDGDRAMRQTVLVDGRITMREVPPQHVVPYWVAHKKPWGISHAWVDGNDCMNVMMPINGYEWPVPMLRNANLDLIRIEILNARSKGIPYRAEYAWLDVLCLWQEGRKNEHLCMEEWKLDVLTIGGVYGMYDPVVCYFNGLGRPLLLAQGDLESDRSWFQRAWTMQEITQDLIIGRETGRTVMEDKVQKCFNEQLASSQEIHDSDSTIDILSTIQDRVSTKPLDKVAGLVYLLWMKSIPIYDAEQSEEDAWKVLVDAMRPGTRAELLFYYPEPGSTDKSWWPSWGPREFCMRHLCECIQLRSAAFA